MLASFWTCAHIRHAGGRCPAVTASGTVSRPRISFKDVAWSFRYQGLKNTVLKSFVLRLTADVWKSMLLAHLNLPDVTIYSVLSSRSSIRPLFQPLRQLRTSSLGSLSGAWFKTKHHTTTLNSVSQHPIPAEPLWKGIA